MNDWSKTVRTSKLRVAIWILPTLLWLLLHFIVWKPMLGIRQGLVGQAAQLNQQQYQVSWLDSTHQLLKEQSQHLEKAEARMETRIFKGQTYQHASDSLRHLLEKHQLEIERLQGRERADTSKNVEIRVTGTGSYFQFFSFVQDIESNDLPFYLENLYIRRHKNGIQFSLDARIFLLASHRVVRMSAAPSTTPGKRFSQLL